MGFFQKLQNPGVTELLVDAALGFIPFFAVSLSNTLLGRSHLVYDFELRLFRFVKDTVIIVEVHDALRVSAFILRIVTGFFQYNLRFLNLKLAVMFMLIMFFKLTKGTTHAVPLRNANLQLFRSHIASRVDIAMFIDRIHTFCSIHYTHIVHVSYLLGKTRVNLW